MRIPPRIQSLARNSFIVAFLLLVGIDAFPSRARAVESLRALIDPIMDVTGLWQGPWSLFAPQVDKENNWIEIRFFLSGTAAPRVERSPSWGELSCWQKFLRSREIEFYDRISNEDNSAAWPSYARYLRRRFEEANSGAIVEKIELRSLTSTLPRPQGTAGKDRSVSSRSFYVMSFEQP